VVVPDEGLGAKGPQVVCGESERSDRHDFGRRDRVAPDRTRRRQSTTLTRVRRVSR